MTWLLLWSCANEPDTTTFSVAEPEAITPEVLADFTIKDGMVQIPEGLVELGPRIIESVKGYTLPQNPQGVTPNMGEGNDQRAGGGPPLPPNPNRFPVRI